MRVKTDISAAPVAVPISRFRRQILAELLAEELESPPEADRFELFQESLLESGNTRTEEYPNNEESQSQPRYKEGNANLKIINPAQREELQDKLSRAIEKSFTYTSWRQWFFRVLTGKQLDIPQELKRRPKPKGFEPNDEKVGLAALDFGFPDFSHVLRSYDAWFNFVGAMLPENKIERIVFFVKSIQGAVANKIPGFLKFLELAKINLKKPIREGNIKELERDIFRKAKQFGLLMSYGVIRDAKYLRSLSLEQIRQLQKVIKSCLPKGGTSAAVSKLVDEIKTIWNKFIYDSRAQGLRLFDKDRI